LSRRRRILAYLLPLVLAVTALAAPASPLVRFAAAVPICPTGQKYEIDRSTPSVAADGARAEWQLRAVNAPDWADGGHTNTTVWLNTNNDPIQWVEVGVTHGWYGSNTYTFYAAHKWWNGSQYQYMDYKIGKPATLGRVVTFSVYKSGSNFRGDVTDSAGTAGIAFSSHALPVPHYDVGAEYTCPGTSRVDKSYTATNQFRRSSDGVWQNASSGTLHPSGISGTGISWCVQPITFRFWVHSQTSTTGCF
jgi:hypothetical protein